MKAFNRRLITFMAALALSLSAVGVSASIAFGGGSGGDQCGVRRTTGQGETKRFCKGESVEGAVITLNGGKTGYACHFRHAPRGGKVESGVIRYFPAEAQTPLCKNTLMSPGPRKETGSGTWRQFNKGDHVLGFAIEINLGPNGRTYFSCAFVKADASGRVNSGVVNPSRFEIRKMKRCKDTDNWRPGFRTESGDASLRFHQGDWVVAAFIRFDDGREFDGNGDGCRFKGTPMDGTLFGGVRNYWPGEGNNLPLC